MAAVVSSSSPFSASSSSSLLSSGFSRTPWFHGVSVKIPFPNRKLVKTLVCVGSGSGLRSASRSQAALSDGHDAWASDSCPRSEIEFLTLCRRLKVILSLFVHCISVYASVSFFLKLHIIVMMFCFVPKLCEWNYALSLNDMLFVSCCWIMI